MRDAALADSFDPANESLEAAEADLWQAAEEAPSAQTAAEFERLCRDIWEIRHGIRHVQAAFDAGETRGSGDGDAQTEHQGSGASR